jgi:hypothetical protein
MLVGQLFLTAESNRCAEKTDSTNSEVVDKIPIDLLPRSEAKPADFGHAEITGTLDTADRKQLELLIGRVPYLKGKVESVITCWSEFVVAAKVLRDRRLIYCCKSVRGEWEIVRIVVLAVD